MYKLIKDSRITPERLFFALLSAWVFLNIFQSIFTEIGSDESYYWVYSRHLDWGYYDHPPMIALIIKFGTFVLGDTVLGVRLFVILIQALFLLVLFKLIDVKKSNENVLIFFIVSFSVVMLQAYGFIATPDVPLLAFTALFLLSYRHYVDANYSWNGALFMAFCMAGLMYSKYHGAFVIIFVVLSNLKLFRKPSFYVSAIVAIALLVPHILWQIHQEFPSFKYHLVERSSGFEWIYFPDFLVNQLPVFNLFTLGAGIYVLFRRNTSDYFERALKFLFAGFLIFFTFWNFKGRVEPHWTIVAAVPMVILVVRETIVNDRLKKYICRVVLPSIILLFFMRAFMIFDVLPVHTEWHGDKQEVVDLKAVAGDKPVVFLSGFQMPSKYRFYAHRESHCMGVLDYRNTQYDIWNFDEAYWGKPVVVNLCVDTDSVKPTVSGKNKFYLVFVDRYQPYKKLKIELKSPISELKQGETVRIPVKMENPYAETFEIHHASMPLQVYLVANVKYNNEWKHGIEKVSSVFESETIPSGGSVDGEITFVVPDYLQGEGTAFFAAGTPLLYPATLEKPLKIRFIK